MQTHSESADDGCVGGWQVKGRGKVPAGAADEKEAKAGELEMPTSLRSPGQIHRARSPDRSETVLGD